MLGFPDGSMVKNLPANAGDLDSIPGSGRSPGEGNGKPLQYSCLENPMDKGAWWTTVHGVARVGHNLATKPPLPPPGIYGLPWWLSGKESACQCRRHEFNPWSRKIPWRRKWQLTLIFLPGKSHGQRSLAGYSP